MPRRAEVQIPAGEAIALQIEALRIQRCARNDYYTVEQEHVRQAVEAALVEAAKIAREYDAEHALGKVDNGDRVPRQWRHGGNRRYK